MMEALSPANIGLLLFGIFFVLLLIGSPIMVALGVATMASFIFATTLTSPTAEA